MNFLNSDIENSNSNPLLDEYFIDLLQTQADREIMCRILILDWKERPIGEIQGLAIDGSINLDASSSVRRNCSLSMIATESTIELTNIDNLVALNKKMKLFIGIKNNIPGYQQKYGDIIWFPMGIFVLTNGSIRHDTSTNTVSLTAQDKMCLLNGEVSGVLVAPTDFASYEQEVKDSDGKSRYVKVYNTLFDIIRTAVIDLGHEDPSKVIILDLPDKVRKSMSLSASSIGTKKYYINTSTGKSSTSPPSSGYDVVIDKENLVVGYDMESFTVPSKELLRQAGDTVTSVLDEIVGILGNYEYYYDVDGNFIFREVRNYLNTTYKPYYQLNNGDYLANFEDDSVYYSFKDRDIISSYSNTPDWLNIKNDFIVWGMKNLPDDKKLPIYYRVAIDSLPFYPEGSLPWQQQLLNYEEEIKNTGLQHGPYYQELAAKWNLAYKDGKWIDNPDYFLDFIDVNSDIGKFSVDNIGRRTKVVVDENVKRMYPLNSPDIEIVKLEKKKNSLGQEMIGPDGKPIYETEEDFKIRVQNDYIDRSVPFVNVHNGGAIKESDLTATKTEKDAFNVVRELLFMHSTMNEVINISCLPLYNFDVNVKIEAEDASSDISGYYMVRSLNIPLSIEGQMSVSAIRANTRI